MIYSFALVNSMHLRSAPTAAVVNKKTTNDFDRSLPEGIQLKMVGRHPKIRSIRKIKEHTDRVRKMEWALELLIQEHESKLDHEHNVGEDETLELASALSQADNEARARLKSVQAENEARLKAAQDEKRRWTTH